LKNSISGNYIATLQKLISKQVMHKPYRELCGDSVIENKCSVDVFCFWHVSPSHTVVSLALQDRHAPQCNILSDGLVIYSLTSWLEIFQTKDIPGYSPVLPLNTKGFVKK